MCVGRIVGRLRRRATEAHVTGASAPKEIHSIDVAAQTWVCPGSSVHGLAGSNSSDAITGHVCVGLCVAGCSALSTF